MNQLHFKEINLLKSDNVQFQNSIDNIPLLTFIKLKAEQISQVNKNVTFDLRQINNPEIERNIAILGELKKLELAILEHQKNYNQRIKL
jgi:hypothetical protein